MHMLRAPAYRIRFHGFQPPTRTNHLTRGRAHQNVRPPEQISRTAYCRCAAISINSEGRRHRARPASRDSCCTIPSPFPFPVPVYLPQVSQALDVGMGWLFVALYAMEAAVLIAAFSPRRYLFSLARRIHLCVLTGLTILTALVSIDALYHSDPVTTAWKVFGVLCVLRLTVINSVLRELTSVAAPNTPAACVLLFLGAFCMCFFAQTGAVWLGSVKFGALLNGDRNFRSFRNAVPTVWGILSLDDWVSLSIECSIRPQQCTVTYEGGEIVFNDCGPQVSGGVGWMWLSHRLTGRVASIRMMTDFGIVFI